MTRVSNVDQVLMLLRQQLQRMTAGERAKRSAKTGAPRPQQRKSAAKRIEALSQAGEFGDEELARMLVRALLVDEFGDAAANDHRFQKLADDVHRLIAADPKANALLRDALRKVGASS